MAIIDIYSKREKNLTKNNKSWGFDDICEKLKVQIIYVWKDILGEVIKQLNYNNGLLYINDEPYQDITQWFCREHGLMSLESGNNSLRKSYFEILANYFIDSNDYLKDLDIIELSMIYMNVYAREDHFLNSRRELTHSKIDNGINEINNRFKEHNIGYRFANNKIIKITSEFSYNEIIQPTLTIINSDKYDTVNKEFMQAYEHYKNKFYSDAISNACKSLETTLKYICDYNGWSYKKDNSNTSKTLSGLIDVVFEEQLVPKYLQAKYTSLKSLLTSSVGTVRNQDGISHGSEPTSINPTDDLVDYVLDMTASTIKYLVKCQENYSQNFS
ncbi:hypothetical protein L3V83_14445 [Thiotrichales bacterium 19X7-9]|nr:hypothetical protein [Thiotrichales bacterium 19X7-9]